MKSLKTQLWKRSKLIKNSALNTLSFVLLFAIAQPVFGQGSTVFSAFPYGSYVNYSGTFYKENNIGGGIYGYLGMGLNHSLEFDAAYSRITFGSRDIFIDGFPFRTEAVNVNQTDVTLRYTNYHFTNMQWHVGYHGIFSSDDPTAGTVIFGGLKRQRFNEYGAEVQVYHSKYSNFTPDFSALQVTGIFGFFFGNAFLNQRFYAETGGSYIRHSTDAGFGATEFASVRQSLKYFYKSLTIEGFVWTGKQAFAVQNYGFVVFNLPEEHQGAFGGSLEIALNPKSSLTLKVSQGRFKELGTSGRPRATTFVVMGAFTL